MKLVEKKTVFYRQHGVLERVNSLKGSYWTFETEGLSVDNHDIELAELLNNYSMDGWELICSYEDKLILRTKEDKETTIETYESTEIKTKGLKNKKRT